MRISSLFGLVFVATLAASALACPSSYNEITSLPYVSPAQTTSDAPTVEITCDYVTASSKGRWFLINPSVYPSGQTFYVTTCTNVTNFDTIIQGYSSTSGSCISSGPGAPVCSLALQADTLDGLCETLQINPDPSQYYWIYVTGYNGAVGTFSISVTYDRARPCFAGVTTFSGTSTGTISRNTAVGGSQVYPPCANLPNAQWGHWYTYSAGDGFTVRMTICPSGSNQDARVTVFRRSNNCNNCGCYTCETPIDTATTGCETLNVPTFSNEPVYWFISHVSPTQNLTYTYSYSRTAPAPSRPGPVAPSNSPTCVSAASSIQTSIPAFRSLSSASIANTTGCGIPSLQTRGSWFRISDLTGVYYLSTCSSKTSFDTIISVFSALSSSGCSSCACLSCVGSNDDVSRIDFPTADVCSSTASIFTLNADPARTYFIFVGPANSATTGAFELSLSRDPPSGSFASSLNISTFNAFMRLLAALCIAAFFSL